MDFSCGVLDGEANLIAETPGLLIDDVINGYVSIIKAKEEYGVVIDENEMKIDLDATNKLKNKMMESRDAR